MRRLKLTAERVKTELKKPKARVVWDQEIPGLGLRIRPSAKGTRGWFVFAYRVKPPKGMPADRTVRWLTLGGYGRPYTAEEGRTWGRDKRELLDKGKDPGAVEVPAARPEDSIPTLAGYVDRYLRRKASGESHKRGKKAKASTQRVDKGNLERIVREHPAVAAKQLHQITQADIEAIVRRKDHAVAGNRWLALLRHLFNAAAGDTGDDGFSLRSARVNGSRWDNPCRNVGPTAEKPRAPRPGPDVWPKLFALLDRYSKQPAEAELKESRRRAQLVKKGEREGESLSESNPVIASLIRMQALTGARGSELRTARRTLLTIHETPGARPKAKPIRTGTLTVIDPKEGGRKEIPLSVEAVRVIDALPAIKGCDFVFPGRSGKDPIDITTVMHWWSRHRGEAGLDGFRLHDLRHFVAGELVAAGASLTQIGELFGHKSAQTTMRYAYLDDSKKKALAGLVSGRITALAHGDVLA